MNIFFWRAIGKYKPSNRVSSIRFNHIFRIYRSWCRGSVDSITRNVHNISRCIHACCLLLTSDCLFQGTYFLDVHPPLGKLTFALIGQQPKQASSHNDPHAVLTRTNGLLCFVLLSFSLLWLRWGANGAALETAERGLLPRRAVRRVLKVLLLGGIGDDAVDQRCCLSLCCWLWQPFHLPPASLCHSDSKTPLGAGNS